MKKYQYQLKSVLWVEL